MRPSALLCLGGILALLAGACSRPARLPSTIPPAGGKPRVAYALRMLDLAEGHGAAAAFQKCLYVHYTGWLTDGRKFDSSRDTRPSGQPRTPLGFPYGAGVVGAGWDKGGLDGMRVGGKRRLFIPRQLGLTRPSAISAFRDVIFDIELMAVADTLARVDSEPPQSRADFAPPQSRADFAPRCPAWSDLPSGS